jgi:hypothetical protein
MRILKLVLIDPADPAHGKRNEHEVTKEITGEEYNSMHGSYPLSDVVDQMNAMLDKVVSNDKH